MAPKLTNAKTSLPETTVKMKTDLKLREPARRIFAQKSRFREKCRFSRFSGEMAFSRKNADFPDFGPNRRFPGIAEKSRPRNYKSPWSQWIAKAKSSRISEPRKSRSRSGIARFRQPLVYQPQISNLRRRGAIKFPLLDTFACLCSKT